MTNNEFRNLLNKLILLTKSNLIKWKSNGFKLYIGKYKYIKIYIENVEEYSRLNISVDASHREHYSYSPKRPYWEPNKYLFNELCNLIEEKCINMDDIDPSLFDNIEIEDNLNSNKKNKDSFFDKMKSKFNFIFSFFSRKKDDKR